MSIRLENVTRLFGEQYAVNDISFEVKTGEIVGFLGPNGAGKTTTMKMITGFLAPTAGKIFINDQPVWENPGAVKKITGYLPENNPLYYDMYVTDYLEYVAGLQQMEKGSITQRVREMVVVCGLDREKHKKIGELSKGYRQRVGLAQALIHDPQILILDEPTTGLDPNQIIEIRNLIKEAGKEKTVILSTHILPEVEAMSDRILIINEGKIVADGSPESLRKASGEGLTVRVRVDADAPTQGIIEALKSIPNVTAVDFLNDNNTYIVTGGSADLKQIDLSLSDRQ
ncbi:MAG: ATP-binding cassette domain-containing protein [Ignavibacteriales bacterium]|nr:ATP-binding cassette domain-containing protein [Ignavibacteriales bacterium]